MTAGTMAPEKLDLIIDDLQEISDRFIVENHPVKKSDMLDGFAFDVDLQPEAVTVAKDTVEELYRTAHHEDAVYGHHLSQHLHYAMLRYRLNNS